MLNEQKEGATDNVAEVCDLGVVHWTAVASLLWNKGAPFLGVRRLFERTISKEENWNALLVGSNEVGSEKL